MHQAFLLMQAVALVPTIPIAPGVNMPLINDGVSNRSNWIASGGRGLDTALTYGIADQQNVGSAVRASGLPRSDFFITTKVPCCPAKRFPFPPAQSNDCGTIYGSNTTADAEHALEALGVGTVDLIVMHWPCDKWEDTVATWRAMEPLVAMNKTRAIGVSNFNASALRRLLAEDLKVKPAVNQCGYSIGGHFDSLWGRDDATVQACRGAGVTYSAYSPLGSWAKSGVHVLTQPDVVAVAEIHNVSAAQVALRWVVQQNITAVTAASNLEYAQQDLDIFGFVLSDEEMKRLAAVRAAL